MDEGDGQVQSVVLQFVFWIGTGTSIADLELKSHNDVSSRWIDVRNYLLA